jgi:hypothetical protein
LDLRRTELIGRMGAKLAGPGFLKMNDTLFRKHCWYPFVPHLPAIDTSPLVRQLLEWFTEQRGVEISDGSNKVIWSLFNADNKTKKWTSRTNWINCSIRTISISSLHFFFLGFEVMGHSYCYECRPQVKKESPGFIEELPPEGSACDIRTCVQWF